jgi:hypothetical protein
MLDDQRFEQGFGAFRIGAFRKFLKEYVSRVGNHR